MKNSDLPAKPLWPNPLPMTKDVQMYNGKRIIQAGCHRPDIFLDNDRSCDFCHHYPTCTISLRRHSTEPKRKRKGIEETDETKAPDVADVPNVPNIVTEETKAPVTPPKEIVTPTLNADGTPKKRRGRPPGSKNKPKVQA